MFASSRQRPQRRRMGRCAEAGCRTLPGEGLAHLFPGRRGVRQSRCLRVPRSRADQIHNTVASEPHPARKDRPSADAPDWAAAERSAALLCELHLSSRELDKIPPGRRQGRMASGRTLSACRLQRDQHGSGRRKCRRLLQQAWHVRTMDQRGQGRDQMDAAVMSDVRGQRCSTSTSRLAYNLGNFLRTLATSEPINDWSLTTLKEKLIKIGAKVISHGRYVAFQIAGVAIPGNLFPDILRMIAELRPPPVISTA